MASISQQKNGRRIPRVRIAQPKGRSIQLRYRCPIENREIRIATNTLDLTEAKKQKRELEAKLILGISVRQKATHTLGPNMPWDDFREEYRTIQLVTISDRSARDAESRLDVSARILKPKRLGDVANSDALHRLQASLLAGVESRFSRHRSPYTVKTYMAVVVAAINWARLQGWISEVPVIRKMKVGKLKAMKGRPIVAEELDRMITKVPSVVGSGAAQSWVYLIRGLYESALRLDEIMHLSWDIPQTIIPEWKRGRLPILHIPASRQKNATEESIPLLPCFEAVLLEAPESQRSGWVFNPESLQARVGRKARHERLQAEWVGKVISRIGQAAGVIVTPENIATGSPAKYASAHDLRRTCAERMLDAGVPPLTISRILRHVSWETTRRHYAPGDIQKDAGILKRLLSVNPDQQLQEGVSPV